MEEILASIKRVIAEDGRVAARPARGSRPAEAPPPEEDVLELSDPIGEPAVAPLVSDDAAAASRQSLAALSALRERSESFPAGSDGPLEAVVREMLKPMLKEWLDTHLPEIVEQLVAREVARITGKSF